MPKINNYALDKLEKATEEDSEPQFYARPEIKGPELEADDDDSDDSDAQWPQFYSEKRIKALETNAKSKPELPPALLADNIEPHAIADSHISEHIESLAQSEELRGLIESAMDGSMEISEPIPDGLPAKLNARALQVVMLRIAGYNGPEIASITGFHKVYVQMLMRHPFARRILVVAGASAIAQATATTRSLRRKVPKMLHVVESIATDHSAEAPVRLRAAFGWLDRANVGPTTRHEVTQTVQGGVTVTHKQASLISTAIREAQGVKQQEETPTEEADFEIVEFQPEPTPEESHGAQLELFG